jgi:ketol-acid reductoisomerase
MTPAGAGVRAAIAGYGNQGGPQARMLRRAGVDIVIGARPGGGAERRARQDGFEVRSPREAVVGASMIGLLVPDEAIPEVWDALAPSVEPAAAIVLAHGFSLIHGDLRFASGLDVVLVSPAGPGRLLEPGSGRAPLAAYVAAHQDGTGQAWMRAETWANWLGCTPLWRTTVKEETDVDLFGEQVVLCGGMNALVRTAFEVLVERGYAPEIAYLECVHQLKHLADLLHERGVAGLRGAISGTALYGDLTRGPRVIGPESRAAMKTILEEIQSGAFAREWAAEVRQGRPTVARGVREGAGHPMEEARRRALGMSTPAPGPG